MPPFARPYARTNLNFQKKLKCQLSSLLESASGHTLYKTIPTHFQAPTHPFKMSDSSSVSSASTAAAPSLAELLAEARQHQKAASDLLKQVAAAAKGLKAPKKKAVDGEKKPRKTSDGQRRWQAFQKFIWDDLKAENPAVPFKAAMQAAGPRWAAGNPISEEDQAAFEAWLEANPIPSVEEAAEAKEAKAAEAAAEKERKKAEREAAKAEKAAATKAAKAAAKDATAKDATAKPAKAAVAKAAVAKPAKGATAKASPAAAAASAIAKAAPKPAAPATPAKKAASAAPAPGAPKKASKGLPDGDHVIDGVNCTVVRNHVFNAEDCSAIGVLNASTGKLDKSAKALAACDAIMAEEEENGGAISELDRED